MLRSNFLRDSGSKPSLVISSRMFSLSSKRMTTFSPYRVGPVETRKSNSFFLPSALYLIMMRPSCGKRFSAMSSLAMIFTRLVMASFKRSGPLQRRRVQLRFFGGQLQLLVVHDQVFHHLAQFFVIGLIAAVKPGDRVA